MILYTTCTFGTNGCIRHLHVAINDGQGWNDLGEPITDGLADGASLTLDGLNRPMVATTASGLSHRCRHRKERGDDDSAAANRGDVAQYSLAARGASLLGVAVPRRRVSRCRSATPFSACSPTIR